MSGKGKMGTERSLVFTKAGNFKRHLQILGYFGMILGSYSRTAYVHINPVPEEIIREHYRNISGLPIFEPTIGAYVDSKNGGIVSAVFYGENIIQRGRGAIGDKDPTKAEPWTVRGMFSWESMELAWNQRRYLNNAIHASSSREDAEREIRLWSAFLRND